MTQRIEHIDIAKGISITLVVLLHSKLGEYVPNGPMSMFRMPIFFFLSGVFFSAGIGPKTFLWKKADALLKPYFVTLFALLAHSVMVNNGTFAEPFAGILYGNSHTIPWGPLWFLTHLFSVYCVSYFIYRYTNFSQLSFSTKSLILAVTLLISAWGIKWFWYINVTVFGHSIKLPGLPFSFDIVLISSCFFLAGHIIRDKVISFRPRMTLFVAAMLVFLCVSLFTDAHINITQRTYRSPIFASLGAVSGIYIILCASFLLTNYKLLKKPLLMLGSGSLFVLIFHDYIALTVYPFLLSYTGPDERVFLIALITFLASIGLPLLIRWAVLKSVFLAPFYLPIRTGKLVAQNP